MRSRHGISAWRGIIQVNGNDTWNIPHGNPLRCRYNGPFDQCPSLTSAIIASNNFLSPGLMF